MNSISATATQSQTTPTNKYIDTHAHIIDPRYPADFTPKQVIADFFCNNGQKLVVIGTHLTDSVQNLLITQNIPNTFNVVGFHPSFADQWDKAEFENFVKNNIARITAIGEIGLDYHYADTDKPSQQKMFDEQMQIAQALNLPVVIHTRDAIGDTMEILQKYPTVTGIVHCFGESIETAKQLIKMGYKIGVGGSTTFKNSIRLQKTILEIGLADIVLETDSPYLTPVPHRGEINKPTFVQYVAKFVADLFAVPLDTVLETTNKNANQILKLNKN